ncbi:hypothetical protein B7463_g10309, partial [Scytalidium lignicola]
MDERTSLLGNPPHNEVITRQRYDSEKLRYSPELRLLTHATIPIALTFALQNIVQALSTFIVGGRGTFELSVASYGYMFTQVTGAMVAIGGATALDTLCSQAITSADYHPHISGQYLQRGIIILAALYLVFIAPLWWFSGHLFIALGQEPDFAMETCFFLRVFIPGGLLQVPAECFKKFLQVQGHSYPVGWIIIISSAIGVVANIILVNIAGLGLLGAPLAHTVYHLSSLVCLVLYSIVNKEVRKCWCGFTIGSLQDWTRFLKLAVPGILTVATEGWSFEIIAMMATRLDPISIAAQGIIMTSDIILYTLPLGLGVAASHRIGNLLGAENGQGARFAVRGPYIVACVLGFIEFVAILSVQNSYGYIFSKDESVVRQVARVLPLMACFQVLDLANNGASGILRGAGKVHVAGFCNILAYYGAGLTTSWYLCFHRDLGVFGLWAGIITGSGTLLVSQTAFIATIKWDHEAKKIGRLS